MNTLKKLVFRKQLELELKRLQNNTNEYIQVYSETYVDQFNQAYGEKLKQGTDLVDLFGDARLHALQVFLYQLEKIKEETESIIFYEKELKPLISDKL